jgi:hypothetical protein
MSIEGARAGRAAASARSDGHIVPGGPNGADADFLAECPCFLRPIPPDDRPRLGPGAGAYVVAPFLEGVSAAGDRPGRQRFQNGVNCWIRSCSDAGTRR